MHRHFRAGVTLALAAFVGACATAGAQQPTPAQAPAGGNGNRPGGPAAGGGPKPYAEVITDKAKSDSGLYLVHQVKDKWYFEIPTALFGREILVVSRQARTATDLGYGGEELNEDVITWERGPNDKILLRVRNYENVASDTTMPIAIAVANSNLPPIVAALDIAAWNRDSSSVVVEVTSLFAKDVPVFGLDRGTREGAKIRRVDDNRSFINWIHSYPTNVEVRATLTYDAGEPPSNGSTGTITLEANQSMVLLPEHPMTPRRWDERVGFFSIQQTDYSRPEQRAQPRRYITRWRLEPKDTAAFLRGELVEPVKPIVYYIDPATPMQWRPYLREGVEDWNVAFAAAGFRNALIAKEPPTPAEDPEFSPEDARYSVIRYFASDVQNAYGPHVSDPRTGEILESDIGWYHNVQQLLRNWFLIQTAAVNPSVRGTAFADSIMGQLIRFVSSHEVGHTLGLPHNMKASSSYPVDSLRSHDFTCRMHTAPSIMDYARFNYVAQPGDNACLYPGIGVYDIYAIRWGYRPIPSARTTDAEKPTLDGWIREHEGDPMYRFGDPSQTDPGSQTEDLGSDGVRASEYGIANLKRILPQLRDWTREPGADHSQLRELYDQVIVQWNRYMGHVTTIVGGMDWTRRASDQSPAPFTVIPKARQQAAVRFLSEQAFKTPTWMIDPETLQRIEGIGILERLRQRQVAVLNNLLEPRRMQRLSESQAVAPGSYTLGELFADVHSAVWSELAAPRPAIDNFRRDLQRGWLDRMNYLMTQELPAPNFPPGFTPPAGFVNVSMSQSDIRANARGELVALRGEIRTSLARVTDRDTRLHLNDVLARVEDILNPRR
ncbi:MAG TPA: zinc-dependent metalloprotease [Gemmatimonadales bacterium]|nr:zinc-dependent metalloprotease [Gemmatimonadales bacterium]